MTIALTDPQVHKVRLARPLGVGSASSDTEAMGSASSDTEATGSASPDIEAAGSASPDLWGQALPRSTPRVRAPPRPMGSHTAANHSRSRRMGLGQNSDTKEKTARPDVTHGRDGPYLRVHIKNSVGRASAVLPNHRTNTDRRVSSSRRLSRWNGTP